MLPVVDKHLLTIGRFAQLTGLTVRALRLYDELDLLRPDAIDGTSRYRYYADDQLARGTLISRLRQIDMPLQDIREYLAAEQAERERILARHRARLRERVIAAQDTIRALNNMSEELGTTDEHPMTVNLTPLARTTVNDQPVMRMCWQLRGDADEEYPLARYFDNIAATIERQGMNQDGPPYCVCPEPEEDGTINGEAGIPVDRIGQTDGRVEAAMLPGGEIGSTRYTGPSGYQRRWLHGGTAPLVRDHGSRAGARWPTPLDIPQPARRRTNRPGQRVALGNQINLRNPIPP